MNGTWSQGHFTGAIENVRGPRRFLRDSSSGLALRSSLVTWLILGDLWCCVTFKWSAYQVSCFALDRRIGLLVVPFSTTDPMKHQYSLFVQKLWLVERNDVDSSSFERAPWNHLVCSAKNRRFPPSFMQNGRNVSPVVNSALPECFRVHARNSVKYFHTEIIFSLVLRSMVKDFMAVESAKLSRRTNGCG